MQPSKLNKKMDRFLEAIQYDTAFLRNVFFKSTASYTHTKLGVFYSLENFKAYIETVDAISTNTVFEIAVGEFGTDDFNTKYGANTLYFNNLDQAVKLATIFGNTKIRVMDSVVINTQVDVSNCNITFFGDSTLLTKAFMKSNIVSAFKVSGTSKIQFKGLDISSLRNGYGKLFEVDGDKATNLAVYFDDFVFRSSFNNDTNFKIIDVTNSEYTGNFSLFANVGFGPGEIIVNNAAAEHYLIGCNVSCQNMACWAISIEDDSICKVTDELTNVAYTNADPQYTLVDPDAIQYNTVAGVANVPTNIMVNMKSLAGIV